MYISFRISQKQISIYRGGHTLTDESLFPYGFGEENDYALRVHSIGYDLAVSTGSYVYHAKSKSYGTTVRNEVSNQMNDVLKHK
jgi:GT2 family glycosyltransferase